MHFVFDLDYTLFDTARHWSDWLDRLVALGFSREEAVRTGESLFGVGYSLEGHGNALGVPEEQLAELIHQFETFTHDEAPNLVYTDVVPFLVAHKDQHQFTILTFGHPDYQQFKVKWSGLGEHIHDVRIAGPERLKVTQLFEMIRETDEPLLFIDDNPKELAAVRDAGLAISLARMMREGARHIDDPIDGEVC